MDVSLIEMEPHEARRKLRSYRKYLHDGAEEEYQAAAVGYQALARGKTLLNLKDVMRAGGFDEKKRPRLAIARADRFQVRFQWQPHSTRAVFDCHTSPGYGRTSPGLRRVVDFRELHEQWVEGKSYQKTITAWSLVPMVPADVRPCAASGLRRYYVLWEVENWSDTRIGTIPDRDPYLLRHLHGELYVVVAEWELTELERAVMAGRADP